MKQHVLTVVLLLGSTPLLAVADDTAPQPCPYGMSQGYGSGGAPCHPGYGPGYGMGPGMMHGPGWGPGYGMGPGMMGPAYGPGPGYGPGYHRPMMPYGYPPQPGQE